MIIRTEQAHIDSEKGTAIVEAAIIILLLFMLIFGVFEAGRFMNHEQVLTNAAREGARLAVTPLSGTNTLPSVGEITDRINVFLASANITGATVAVDPIQVLAGGVQTDYTRVRVDHTYNVITLPGYFFDLGVNLRGEALMRNETSN